MITIAILKTDIKSMRRYCHADKLFIIIVSVFLFEGCATIWLLEEFDRGERFKPDKVSKVKSYYSDSLNSVIISFKGRLAKKIGFKRNYYCQVDFDDVTDLTDSLVIPERKKIFIPDINVVQELKQYIL